MYSVNGVGYTNEIGEKENSTKIRFEGDSCAQFWVKLYCDKNECSHKLVSVMMVFHSLLVRVTHRVSGHISSIIEWQGLERRCDESKRQTLVERGMGDRGKRKKRTSCSGSGLHCMSCSICASNCPCTLEDTCTTLIAPRLISPIPNASRFPSPHKTLGFFFSLSSHFHHLWIAGASFRSSPGKKQQQQQRGDQAPGPN